MSKADDARKEAKRKAVAARIVELQSGVNLLTGMLDEKTLDAMLLAFGLGHVELND